MLSRLIAWLKFVIPVLVVGGAYGIAMHQEVAEACVPFWEGCTSISRAARHGDALFWFRGFMMPLSMLLVIYWIYQWRWLNCVVGPRRRHHAVLALGVVSALALVLYANYLGSEGDFYRFMRRFGVMFYFALAMLAQLISLESLHSVRLKLDTRLRPGLRLQWTLVSIQWGLGAVSLWVDTVQPPYEYQAENIIEWNFALAMVAFYGVSGWLWRDPPGLSRPPSLPK